MEEIQQFDPNLYKIVEDEELDEVDFFEILTLDEIVKNNPTFLAFSKEEIFNELYSFFKNSNKSDAISEMFFKQRNDKDISNFVFITDGVRTQFDCDIQDFVSKFNVLEKTQYTVSQNEKNKLMFALSYDSNSKKLRMKPHMKTTIEIHNEDVEKELNIYYPVSEQDDTNIPILAAYYKRPTSSQSDIISRKIASIMEKPELMNYRSSDAYSELNDLIKAVKPKISDIIKYFNFDNDNFDMDYEHIDALMSSFNSSFEDIDVEEFKLLKSFIESHISQILPEHIKYKQIPSQKMHVQNNKLSFYEKLHRASNPLNIEEKTEEIDQLIMILQEEKMELSIPPLLYTNMIDIISAVSNGDITIEVVVENIMKNREGIILDNIISNLQNFSKNDFANYETNLENIFNKFSTLKNIYHDMYELRFLDFYKDSDEIKESNDLSSYEGIPDVYRNDTTYEGNVDLEEYIIEDVPLMKITTDIEKFWLSTKYKGNVGFIEMLKLALPIIQNVQDIANVVVNYELLSDELFKHFAGIPTKIHLLNELFKRNDVLVEKSDVEKLVKIKPSIVLNSTDVNWNFNEEVKECNKQFLEIFYKMMYTSIAWWSIQLQSDIIDDVLVFDENSVPISYLEKWSDKGFLSSATKDGVLAYLSAILEDVLVDVDIYNVPRNISSNSKDIVVDLYDEQYQILKTQSVKIQKKMNKGEETRKSLREKIQEMKDNKTARQNKNNIEKLLNGYIDALMYMPSYKYQKNHKFLLGCCMQEIGPQFTPYMDFDKMGRTDLISAKLSYAKNRMTNKTSYPLYYIPLSEIEDDNLEEITPFSPPKSSFLEETTVNTWLEKMKDVSLLLPSFIIEEIQKGTSKVENDTVLQLRILTKTAGYKNKNDLENNLLQKNANKSNILMLVRKELHSFSTEDSNERMLLEMAVSELRLINDKLKELFTLYNEYNEKEIDMIHNYILSRSLCLPFNPDISNNNILKSSIEVSGDFVENITKLVYTSVLKYSNAVDMPTEQENLDFINKIREKNKDKKLSFMNQKTQEERELYDQLKQIGVKHENFETDDYDDEAKDDSKIIYDNIEINEGENEFRMQNEDDYDDDNLDNENFGFLHD